MAAEEEEKDEGSDSSSEGMAQEALTETQFKRGGHFGESDRE